MKIPAFFKHINGIIFAPLQLPLKLICPYRPSCISSSMVIAKDLFFFMLGGKPGIKLAAKGQTSIFLRLKFNTD